jgi:hypothetical protein
MPPSECRGRFGGHTGTNKCSLINLTRWWPICDASNRCSPRQDCGKGDSSSAIGLRMPPPEEPFVTKAENGVVATACLYRDAHILRDAATLLGRHEDAEHFGTLAERTRVAFNDHYVRPEGVIHSDAETTYALAIVFGLLDPDDEQVAGNRLNELVARSGYLIQTGFAGTPFITRALTKTGHLDTAYQLLSRQNALPGSIRSRWGRQRSGSGGIRCCPTAPSIRAR